MTPTDLRTLRQALNLSQYQLAKELGLPYTTVWRWERGDHPIQHPRVLRLALLALHDGHRLPA